LNELFLAYERFFSQFMVSDGVAVGAHVSGNPALDRLPNGQFVPARFPYIVYEVTQPTMFGSAVSIVSIWDRDLMPNGAPGRPNFYGRVNDIAGQILSKIHPEDGVLLSVGDGQFVQLLRGNVPFQVVSSGEYCPTFVRVVINLTVFGVLK